MMKRILATAVVLALLSLNASAEGNLDITGTINGVDPTTKIATINAGEITNVRINVDAPPGGATVTNVVFASYPSALAIVLNRLVEKRGGLPVKLNDTSRVETAELPGITPAGVYEVTARVYYTYEYKPYTETIEFTVNVASGGIISTVLGWVIRIMPDFVMRQLVKAAMYLVG